VSCLLSILVCLLVRLASGGEVESGHSGANLLGVDELALLVLIETHRGDGVLVLGKVDIVSIDDHSTNEVK
jgi:hypothetical protein